MSENDKNLPSGSSSEKDESDGVPYVQMFSQSVKTLVPFLLSGQAGITSFKVCYTNNTETIIRFGDEENDADVLLKVDAVLASLAEGPNTPVYIEMFYSAFSLLHTHKVWFTPFGDSD